ncbi:unnamed protein product [Callosobruchus maculatus]|uniref:RAP domain-containing protein n=1 Tax=Callosobruchus maculatus TaxID=64391 RepID=A0A653CZF2_CALMS|nr:unnamed protein product [Callosobruchus maculatus]
MFKLIRQANPQKCGLFTSLTRYSNFSSSTSAELKNILPSQNDIVESDGASEGKLQKSKVIYNFKPQNSLVAAAFASLNENHNSDIKTPYTDKKIDSAKTTEELLSVSEGSGVSRRHALKVVSILADWAMSGKVNLKDFEADPRFIRLCRILTKGSFNNQKSLKPPVAAQSEDLSTILGVTADDEAAKLVECITLPQMVKVMSTLAMKKRRSMLLLRSLAYNITANSTQLDLKQSGDLLYSMSSLNFIDENLLAKVANDICQEIDKAVTTKSSVVGSILTSVGLLKYKDPALLDALSEWITENCSICRAQDIFSLLMTLAILQYTPQNAEKLYEVILPLLTPSEAGKALQWLEVVWSLVLLGRASEEHVSGVLNNTFIDKLMLTGPDSLPLSAKLKLLNIDGAAEHLLKGYSGARIPADSPIKDTEVVRTKDKQAMANSVVDALSHLIQSELLLRTKINTKYGFYIDAECLLDKKCSPLPLTDSNSGKEAVKIAIIAYDYHDMTRGRVAPTGLNAFASEILKAQGYRILSVPYTEFKPLDKLIHRVKYLETKLKELIKS